MECSAAMQAQCMSVFPSFIVVHFPRTVQRYHYSPGTDVAFYHLPNDVEPNCLGTYKRKSYKCLSQHHNGGFIPASRHTVKCLWQKSVDVSIGGRVIQVAPSISKTWTSHRLESAQRKIRENVFCLACDVMVTKQTQQNV